jgi:TRAP transporter TAXI family solute receptor
MTSSTRCGLAAAAACLLLVATPAARSQPSSPAPTILTLATATPGGGFPLYGDALAAVVHDTDPTLVIRTTNTKGSTENIPLLERGAVDLGLVQGEAAHDAFAGIGQPRADLKIVAAMYSTPGFFVVRADSPYRTIADLRGRAIAFGARGSGLVILARYVLDGLGLDMDRDFDPVLLDHAGDGPAMVADGRVAALWGGGVGWPGFRAVMNGPGGGRLIAPSAGEIGRITGKHDFLKPLVLPAGSYPHQDAPLRSVGSWSLVLARPGLDDEVAYRLARALHEAESTFAAGLPQARETTSANTLAAAPRRAMIHPGVLRYLGELGL